VKRAIPTKPSLHAALLRWWGAGVERNGLFSTARTFLQEMWGFLRESTPEQRRRRYGDIEYDWDYAVNTTSATVSWRDRLLGVFHSAYQPTEPAAFHEMLAAVPVDVSGFTFIDLGSGKGRTLLMASEYPFRRIIGVELLPALNRVACENLQAFKGAKQRCFAIESICGDAREFEFPTEPTVLYLFNPLPEAGLATVVRRLGASAKNHPRPIMVLYHNPIQEQILMECAALKKIGGTHQYSIFTTAA
jgi:SAM-dependent methyltransferase